MREKINNKYVYWGLTAFCVLASIVFFFFCLYRWVRIKAYLITFFQIFLPFIYGLVIAYMLNPVVNLFDNKVFGKMIKKKKNKEKRVRALSITAASVIFIGVIVALFSLLIPNMIKSIETLAGNINIYLSDSKSFILSFSSNNKY